MSALNERDSGKQKLIKLVSRSAKIVRGRAKAEEEEKNQSFERAKPFPPLPLSLAPLLSDRIPFDRDSPLKREALLVHSP